MGYSFWLAASDLLYAPSYSQDIAYHWFWYTSCGALAGMRNGSTMKGWSDDPSHQDWTIYHKATSHSPSHVGEGRKEGNVLFIDTLNTFYLCLYGIRHMIKDLSDSEKGNPLLPHGLLFQINSKGSFICTIPQTGWSSNFELLYVHLVLVLQLCWSEQ